MNATLTRIGAVAAKEFTHVRRDRRVLAMVLVLPMVMLLLLAYAISFDVRNVPTAIVDLDHTPASQSYARDYATSGLFDVVRHEDSMTALDALFDRNVVRVAVVIPAGFARTLASGHEADVGVLIDGSEPNSAKVAQAYAGALNQLHSQGLTLAWADAQGIDVSQIGMVEAQAAHLVQPGAALVGLPDPGPDGRGDHDRHRHADRGHPGQGARAGHRGAAEGLSPCAGSS